jgi:hypothetical protein
MLERFVSGAAQPAGSPASPLLGTATNTAYGVNAGRDWGIQLFDSFIPDEWDLTYALMLGRGEAIQEKNSADDNIELYLYASAEYDLPGGLGADKHGVKFYGWYQHGQREFSSDPERSSYERIRYGIGSKLLGRLFQAQYKYRLGVELMFADGIIFIAPTGGVANGNVGNGDLQIAAEPGNRSRGATLDLGFFPNNKWQFDLRFHQHALLYQTSASINPGNERLFNETTVGVNYHFSRQLRLTFNYVFREVTAPAAFTSSTGILPAEVAEGLTSNVRTLVDNVDDRVLLQLTWML